MFISREIRDLQSTTQHLICESLPFGSLHETGRELGATTIDARMNFAMLPLPAGKLFEVQ
jgi:hypothetical protein